MKVHKYYEPAIANHKIIQNLTPSYKLLDIVVMVVRYTYIQINSTEVERNLRL